MKSYSLIRSAEDAYNNLRLEKAVEELTKNTYRVTAAGNFNTLFIKKAGKASSFKIFEKIRKTKKCCAYFHVPFCKSLCIYCIYEKTASHSKQQRMRYLRALKKEVLLKKSILGQNFNPDILYVGGGTPMVMDIGEIDFFLETLAGSFDIKDNLEFTFETTPGAIARSDSLEKLILLKNMGVNRINVGVESFSGAVMRKNGRVQSLNDIRLCFTKLRQIGFKKINLDLIYGLMGQNMEAWKQDLEQTVKMSPDSITTFSLRLWSPSKLYETYLRQPGLFPAEKNKTIMRIMALRYFSDTGYFEDNSDYFIKSENKKYMYHPSQPHNISRNLIGCGPSAYSIAGDMQLFNVKEISDYVSKIEHSTDPIDRIIRLNKLEYMKKMLADGLRTKFDDKIFSREFSSSAFIEFPGMIKKLASMGLIRVEKPIITLTYKGKVIADYISNFIKYSKY